MFTKKIVFLLLLAMFVSVRNSVIYAQDFPVLKGPYLGQKPPGMKAELFAPGIITTGYNDYSAAFSPDGKEFLFGLYGDVFCSIVRMKMKNNIWTSPQVAPFSGKYFDTEPHFAYTGNLIAFASKRPLDSKGEPSEHADIWFSKKTEKGWSEPQNPGATINSEKEDFYPSFSRNGDLYFASNRNGISTIYVAKNINGNFTKPEILSNMIHSEEGEIDPYSAPDDSYIIFCSWERPDGYGENDLYISFQKEDGTWTKAINMGNNINSNKNEVAPYISPDGKYLFFNSNRRLYKSYSENPIKYKEMIKLLNSPGNGSNDIYWVDARIIEQLKPDK